MSDKSPEYVAKAAEVADLINKAGVAAMELHAMDKSVGVASSIAFVLYALGASARLSQAAGTYAPLLLLADLCCTHLETMATCLQPPPAPPVTNDRKPFVTNIQQTNPFHN